jgi:hypothetical protein
MSTIYQLSKRCQTVCRDRKREQEKRSECKDQSSKYSINRINNDSMIKISERTDCRDVIGISENTEQLISAQKMREASAVRSE